MTRWLEENGFEEDVVVSTRLRIARNMNDFKFPGFMTLDEADGVTNRVLGAMKDKKENYRLFRINDLSARDRNVFVEEHLISPNLAKTSEYGSFLLREDQRVTIMINEEDHIRIQVLLPGLNIDKSWEMASEIDDYLGEKTDYAYDRQFGYLTSCPTNVGTGLRASAMVHLPSITMIGHLNAIIDGLRKIGLTARGLYGEGSKALGHFFQISNQTTLGESEEDIIKKLTKVIYQIVARERSTRNYMLSRKRMDLEDRVFRSLGILNYSRIISTPEAMTHLSNVKLGCDMGIIKGLKSKDIVKLMIDIQGASIEKLADKNLSKEEIDIYRAEILRKNIISMEG